MGHHNAREPPFAGPLAVRGRARALADTCARLGADWIATHPKGIAPTTHCQVRRAENLHRSKHSECHASAILLDHRTTGSTA